MSKNHLIRTFLRNGRLRVNKLSGNSYFYTPYFFYFRQAIETVYSDYLGKGSHPWVYLSLEMPGKNIDVNVHPTKLEVHFLHDEKIIARIQKEFDSHLAPSSNDRVITLAPTFLTNHETTVFDLNDSMKTSKDNAYQKVE